MSSISPVVRGESQHIYKTVVNQSTLSPISARNGVKLIGQTAETLFNDGFVLFVDCGLGHIP